MAEQFEQNGIRFSYPENWRLEREENETGWTVLVQSPETAFLVVSLDTGMPEIETMAQTALDALRGEYEDLEADDCVESVAGQPAVGHDVRFFSLDLTNGKGVEIRASSTSSGLQLTLGAGGVTITLKH